jgi:hypothetical protein
MQDEVTMKPSKTKPVVKLPARVIRQIAVEAMTDPRTVARVLSGKPTREATRTRVQIALRIYAKEYNNTRMG